jgi:hypothetical protein
MAVTINATPGDAAANSYVTEVEQIAYMATRLNLGAWVTVSGATCTETEKQGMVEATRELTAMGWQGVRVTEEQALSWPRDWVPNPDSPTWQYFDSTVVPKRVKDAACELAFQFVKAGTTDLAAADAEAGVIEKTIDVLTTRWDGYRRPTGLSRFPSVLRTIQVLLTGTASHTIPLVRG